MNNEETNAAIATRIMGWTLCDRVKLGWGEGPPVWSTGRPGNPTEMYYSPSTDIRQARAAAKKARVKMTTNDPAELCRIILSSVSLPDKAEHEPAQSEGTRG